MEQEKISAKTIKSLIDEDRVISFSDAVFAFAATLLVLKIDLPALTQPEVTSPRMLAELINLWPSYFANIISFLVIGYYWLTHHAIFSLIKKMNNAVIWINIIFLIFLSFLPFPVDLFGDYNQSDIVIIFYSLSLAIVGFLLCVIWFYTMSAKLTDPDLTSRHKLYYSLRFLIAPIVFTLSIPLVYIDPSLSKISWIFVIIGTLIVDKVFHFKTIGAFAKETA